MRVADNNMTRPNEECPLQQGSERSQTQGKPCVEVKIHAALVLLLPHMDSGTVECVGKSLATSLEDQIPLLGISSQGHGLKMVFLMAYS